MLYVTVLKSLPLNMLTLQNLTIMIGMVSILKVSI